MNKQFCDNCQCDRCYAQKQVPCRDCRELFLSTLLGDWERCAACEVEHAKWLKEIEGKRHGTALVIIDGMPSNIRNARMGFEHETLQPTDKDGRVNPAFVSKYGTRAYKKELKFTKDQFKENGGYE